jgi:hypothetical protein
MRFPRWPHYLAAAWLLLATTACSLSTPFQPLSTRSPVTGGYTDQRLGPDKHRVDFFGNTLTSRERVETYLLFRAAQLTVEQNGDWFVVVDHEMDHKIEIIVRPDPSYRPAFSAVYGEWRPYWRYEGSSGWQDWDPYHGEPFWADRIAPRLIESFHATAEIRIGRGPVPTGEDKAMIAREVIARLGSDVRYPED